MQVQIDLTDYPENKIFTPEEIVKLTSYSSIYQLKKYRLALENGGYNFGRHGKKGQNIRYDKDCVVVLQAMFQQKESTGETIEEIADSWEDWVGNVEIDVVKPRQKTKNAKEVIGSSQARHVISTGTTQPLPESLSLTMPDTLQSYLQEQQRSMLDIVNTVKDSNRDLSARLETAQLQAGKAEDNHRHIVDNQIIEIRQLNDQVTNLNREIKQLKAENKRLSADEQQTKDKSRESSDLINWLIDTHINSKQIKELLELAYQNASTSMSGKVKLNALKKTIDATFQAKLGKYWTESDKYHEAPHINSDSNGVENEKN